MLQNMMFALHSPLKHHIAELEKPRFLEKVFRFFSGFYVIMYEDRTHNYDLQIVFGGTLSLTQPNSASHSSIEFEFGTEFHHVTGHTLQMFKVKGQDHSVG